MYKLNFSSSALDTHTQRNPSVTSYSTLGTPDLHPALEHPSYSHVKCKNKANNQNQNNRNTKSYGKKKIKNIKKDKVKLQLASGGCSSILGSSSEPLPNRPPMALPSSEKTETIICSFNNQYI